jgi:hypothetical protein
VAIEPQHGTDFRLSRVLPALRFDALRPRILRRRPVRLPAGPPGHGIQRLELRWQRRRRSAGGVAVGMDRVLLGLVDRICAIRGPVPGPDIPWPDDPRIHHRSHRPAVVDVPGLADAGRRHGHRPGAEWRREPRDPRCGPVRAAVRYARTLVVADTVRGHVRRGCRPADHLPGHVRRQRDPDHHHDQFRG